MRIRRILQISAAVGIGSVVLVMAMIVGLQRTDAAHAAATINLNAAVRKIVLIQGVHAELSGPSRARAMRQRQAQFAELAPILAAIPAFNSRAQSLKVRIVEGQVALGVLLDKLARTDGDVARISEQLDVRTSAMVSDVLAINDLAADYVNRQKRGERLVMAASLLLLAMVVIGLLLIFQRRIVGPIVTLEHATGLLCAGTFDQAVAFSGSDEISALASSFESMRIGLDAARTLIRAENATLAQRVDERTAELVAANRELDSFAYAVSHDLRAPLRAMSGFSHALTEDLGAQLSDDVRVDLEQINLASLRMGELIDALLALSRSSRAELRHDTVDISAMARAILAELARTDPDPQRQIDCAIESGLSVRGDARMLDTLMTNLLNNAWKYTQHTPRPSIRVYASEGNAAICIADNGAGFDMAHAGKLFEPFQRLHRQEEFAGIGIGLATVSRIVQRHGGVMTADGAPGKGATFCFALPPADDVLKDKEPP